MSKRSHRRWALVTALAMLAGSAPFTSSAEAWADEPSASDKETARSLMKEGDAAMRDGDAAKALERYEAAKTIVDVPTTRVAVARALEKLGRLIEARSIALGVTRSPPKDSEPAAFAKARTEAQALSKAILPRIASLQIQLDGEVPEQGLRAEIDGKPLYKSVITVARRVDPGEHEVLVAATGYAPVTVTVTLAEGETKIVPVELKERWTEGGSDVTPAKTPVAEEAPQDPSDGSLSPLVPIGFSVAGAGAIFGAITGIISLGKTSDAEAQCVDGRCPTSVQGDLDDAQTMATLSNVGFIVGGVGLGVGIVGLFLSGGGESGGDSASWVQPTLGIGSAGVRGRF